MTSRGYRKQHVVVVNSVEVNEVVDPTALAAMGLGAMPNGEGGTWDGGGMEAEHGPQLKLYRKEIYRLA